MWFEGISFTTSCTLSPSKIRWVLGGFQVVHASDCMWSIDTHSHALFEQDDVHTRISVSACSCSASGVDSMSDHGSKFSCVLPLEDFLESVQSAFNAFHPFCAAEHCGWHRSKTSTQLHLMHAAPRVDDVMKHVASASALCGCDSGV